jgi:uncharacterized membrane protein (UPF0127 family)
MQNNAIARIKWGPKTFLWIVAVVLVGLALYLSFFASNIGGNTTLSVPQSTKKYSLRVADTPELRTKGLSNTKSLPRGEGMLFVFKTANHACFWMKDMNYALDMVWLDADKKVVNLQANVQPSTYPDESFCSRNKRALYVIELNAGEIENAHIGLGQTLKF